MNWYLLFYLFSIVERLSTACVIMTILCVGGIILTFTLIETYYVDEKDEVNNARLRRWRPWLVSTGFLFLSFSIVIPTKKDLLLIIAGGAVGNFVTSDSSAKALPADLTRFLRGQILKASADLKEDVLLDGERSKLKQMSQDELVNLLMRQKADSLERP